MPFLTVFRHFQYLSSFLVDDEFFSIAADNSVHYAVFQPSTFFFIRPLLKLVNRLKESRISPYLRIVNFEI